MRRLFLVVWAGICFLWTFRDRKRWWRLLPPADYLLWRLGTVYGVYPENDGARPPKPLRALAAQAWRDRDQVVRFLLWWRDMRKRGRR